MWHCILSVNPDLPPISRKVTDEAEGRYIVAAVSAASADQRRGRAGRLRPGLCLRLWSADEKLQEEDAPAVVEEDLTGTILSLAASGVPPGSVQSLPWLDPPPQKSLDHAVEVLTLLGAFENKEDSLVLSPHGRAMARLPLHPRLAHLALKAPTIQDDGTEDADSTVAELCALLEQERDTLQLQERGAKVSAAPRCADARVRLLALKTRALPDRLKGIRAIPAQCQQVLQSAAQLHKELPSATKAVRIRDPGPFLALAYPERIARRVKNNRFLLRDGTSCIVKDPILQQQEHGCKQPSRSWVSRCCLTQDVGRERTHFQELLAVGRMFRTNVVTLAAPLTASEAFGATCGSAWFQVLYCRGLNNYLYWGFLIMIIV
ncbi:dhx16 [Symbiodinium sp. CCMP2592]|nr:dhx16 [Symbiodinium sp. CCMP2592]